MGLPLASNSTTGLSGLPAQLLAPQRSATQMCPLLSPATLEVEPKWRPSGNLKKCSSAVYGSGWVPGALRGSLAVADKTPEAFSAASSAARSDGGNCGGRARMAGAPAGAASVAAPGVMFWAYCTSLIWEDGAAF